MVCFIVGATVVHFAGSFGAHTTRAKTSPDGRWSLVIDTYDEGALGGSTKVDSTADDQRHRRPDNALRRRLAALADTVKVAQAPG